MRSRIILAGAAAAALALPPAAALGQDGTAAVSVVHGIPGTPVDVYVNGDLTLDDFQPGSVAGPLSLPGGEYSIAVRAADAEASADPLFTGSAEVGAGDNASLVAHLDEGGDPRLTAFANDTSEIPAGQARLTVRHAAAAPAVDILAAGEPIIEGLENPREESVEVDAATVSVGVAPAGETDPVIGPTDLSLAAGGNYAVYAIGSLEDETTELLVQGIGASAGAPGTVPAGDSGLLDEGGGGLVLALGAALALLVLGASVLTLARGRRTT